MTKKLGRPKKPKNELRIVQSIRLKRDDLEFILRKYLSLQIWIDNCVECEKILKDDFILSESIKNKKGN